MALEIQAWGRGLSQSSDVFCTTLRERLGTKLREDGNESYYVALEHDPVKLRLISRTIPRKNRMLVIFEPKSVNPLQHTRRIRRKYGKVVVTSELHKMLSTDIVWDYGVLPPLREIQAILKEISSDFINREFAIGLINENKFSTNRDEAYTLRQRLIQKLARADYQVAVAGANWTKGIIWYVAKQIYAATIQIRGGHIPRITKLRLPFSRAAKNKIQIIGRVPTQVGFLSACSYSLVIENEPTYVTEKLFNALLAGSYPLYIGPDLNKFGVPNNIAPNLPQPFMNAIGEALLMSAKDRASWVRSAHQWLQEPQTQLRWGLEPSVDRLVEIISAFSSSN